MRESRYLMLAALAGFAVVGLACTQKAVDEALDASKEGAATVIDETQKASASLVSGAGHAAERTAVTTKELAGEAAEKAAEIAGNIATKTNELAATTGEAITDTWITAKVAAQFVDEALLKGSDINVDTDNHVVTLRGAVASTTAKNRAAAIASGTEGVTSVVNQLVVGSPPH